MVSSPPPVLAEFQHMLLIDSTENHWCIALVRVERTPAETEAFEESGTGLIFAVCLEVSFSTFWKPFWKSPLTSGGEAMLIYPLISSRSFHCQVHFFLWHFSSANHKVQQFMFCCKCALLVLVLFWLLLLYIEKNVVRRLGYSEA